MLKEVIRETVSILGYRIQRSDRPCRTLRGGAELIRRYFQPDFAVDVGVLDGTPELYETFPSTPFLLVDALPDTLATLQRYHLEKGYFIENVFCGSSQGEVEFYCRPGGKSSNYTRWGGVKGNMVYRLPVSRLDDLVEKHRLSGRALLKVDVEGGEIDVLKGAPNLLKNSEFVILETVIKSAFDGGPEFFDVVAYMYEHGFCVFDVLDPTDSFKTGNLEKVDLVFTRKNSSARERKARMDS